VIFSLCSTFPGASHPWLPLIPLPLLPAGLRSQPAAESGCRGRPLARGRVEDRGQRAGHGVRIRFRGRDQFGEVDSAGLLGGIGHLVEGPGMRVSDTGLAPQSPSAVKAGRRREHEVV